MSCAVRRVEDMEVHFLAAVVFQAHVTLASGALTDVIMDKRR